jgi:hypothetical protein
VVEGLERQECVGGLVGGRIGAGGTGAAGGLQPAEKIRTRSWLGRRLGQTNGNRTDAMIPNHSHFVEAIQENKKVKVLYYSAPDSGVVDRICAPLDYGPGAGGASDGMNRYWLLVYSTTGASQTVGLVPDQIVDLKVLGETFEPSALGVAGWPWAIARHAVGVA